MAVAAAVLTAIQGSLAPIESASAANAANFDPGNIISDEVFYDSSTMDTAQIQAFLNSKVAQCRSGYVCLKDYWQATTYHSSVSGACSPYSANSHESAALTIYKVAAACGINPRVLIVLLEKEQGLVTDDWPTTRQYRSATGYGCPDTSDCDSTYYGFFNQLYNAAKQFKYYRANPAHFNFIAGRANTILWNPDVSCGSSSVYIKNQATAGLYDYTPYRPNQAAMNNLYGTGDGCSAYGNRNFWRLFTDWFGSTTGPVVMKQFQALYDQTGGYNGLLGAPTGSGQSYSDGGVGQGFQRGWAYWSNSTGAFRTSGAIGMSYVALRGPTSNLGYPTGSQASEPDGGYSQSFENGSLYWSSKTDVDKVMEPFRTTYLKLDGASGSLQFPVDSQITLANGATAQLFQGGWLQSDGKAVISVAGRIGKSYIALGAGASDLGYPTGAETSEPGGGYSQPFQNGTLYWSSKTDMDAVMEPIRTAFLSAGGASGSLGFPVDGRIASADGGFAQQFQGGWMYWSQGTGAKIVKGATNASYRALGAAEGDLGYPTSPQVPEPDGGYSQAFQNGSLYWSSTTNMDSVMEPLRAAYINLGGAAGPLRFPVDGRISYPGGGYGQKFQGAWMYWSAATGAKLVKGPIAASYEALGSAAGALGYPTSEQVSAPGGGYSQAFQNGSLYWSAKTDMDAVMEPLRAEYLKAGGASGALGYPVDGQMAFDGGGFGQKFQGGWMYWSKATGAMVVNGQIGASYRALGAPNGSLGYPTGAQASEPGGGYSQAFQHGTLYWSAQTDMDAVMEPLREAYLEAGGAQGPMGFPVDGRITFANGGYGQRFQGGWLYWSEATGAKVVSGATGASYRALGAADGKLGYPTAAQVSLPDGGYSQSFQNGSLYFSAATDMDAVMEPLRATYLGAGGPSGSLGFPVDGFVSRADGTLDQKFQHGHITWSKASGAQIKLG